MLWVSGIFPFVGKVAPSGVPAKGSFGLSYVVVSAFSPQCSQNSVRPTSWGAIKPSSVAVGCVKWVVVGSECFPGLVVFGAF